MSDGDNNTKSNGQKNINCKGDDKSNSGAIVVKNNEKNNEGIIIEIVSTF